MIFPERFRHHRQREQAEHILFVRFAQLNAHSERRDGSDRRAFIYDAELGDAFGHEFMEGERNVAGLHRCAIVKTCPRVQRDFRPGEVIGVTYVLGNQRIVAAGPQDFAGLVVRVAGYSAFFVELSKEIQDDIIRRTAHQL